MAGFIFYNMTMDINESKRNLRKQVNLQKTALKRTEAELFSEIIFKKVEEIPEFIASKTILAYWSIEGEVITHRFIEKWAGKKRILLPSVDGEIMHIKEYKSDQALISGERFGIPEPDGPLFKDFAAIDFIIVPGVAFDLKNNRMGRGKAYYDRFLKSIKAYKCGICFSFQLFSEIPADENDICMDCVVTNVS